MDPSVYTPHMTRALALAEKARGWTHPNPMVGAVVLDAQGHVVGEGFHAQYGAPHAEVMALQQAAGRAQGGTIVVTLEPCNHTGQTPPCTQAVLASGVQTVVIGARDPNPKVAGGGAQVLRDAGLAVIEGVMTAECLQQNEAFFYAVEAQRPFVVVKQALTLDGRIATQAGHSQWITRAATRQWVHQLRAHSDAIVSTAQTVMADNAQLTVRGVQGPVRAPVRVILDRTARMQPEALALFQSMSEASPVWVVTALGQETHPNSLRAKAMGARILTVTQVDGKLSLDVLMAELHTQRLTQVLVEAGSQFTGSLLAQGWVQKLWLTFGNQLLMDPQALPAFSAGPVLRLDKALQLTLASAQIMDNNLIVEAYPKLSKRA